MHVSITFYHFPWIWKLILCVFDNSLFKDQWKLKITKPRYQVSLQLIQLSIKIKIILLLQHSPHSIRANLSRRAHLVIKVQPLALTLWRLPLKTRDHQSKPKMHPRFQVLVIRIPLEISKFKLLQKTQHNNKQVLLLRILSKNLVLAAGSKFSRLKVKNRVHHLETISLWSLKFNQHNLQIKVHSVDILYKRRK